MDPTSEGVWLATETDPDVAGGRDYFGVDLAKLQAEFSAISPMPPAAFDRRLYEGARVHSEDLILRDAQDHIDQFDQVTDAGFSRQSIGGVVFSYTRSGLHAHAAFNIDWGSEPDGMQTGRGHRVVLMSDGHQYMNVGIASVHVTEAGKSVGPFVVTGNYAQANTGAADHYNAFIVGTVWIDANGNGWYDAGEGYEGVSVVPSIGTYYAVTGDAGGYAIPITETGIATIAFSGGALPVSGSVTASLSATSVLVDYIPQADPGSGRSFLPAIHFLLSLQDSVADSVFSRSTSDNLVNDAQTGLVWQDAALSFKDEADGITYCNGSTLDGFDDWRLPSLAEISDFFHRVDADVQFDLNAWGTFSGCTANVAVGGYVKTPVGADQYGGSTGDPINFSGGAAARCVR
jgi:hypothetical protein